MYNVLIVVLERCFVIKPFLSLTVSFFGIFLVLLVGLEPGANIIAAKDGNSGLEL